MLSRNVRSRDHCREHTNCKVMSSEIECLLRNVWSVDSENRWIFFKILACKLNYFRRYSFCNEKYSHSSDIENSEKIIQIWSFRFKQDIQTVNNQCRVFKTDSWDKVFSQQFIKNPGRRSGSGEVCENVACQLPREWNFLRSSYWKLLGKMNKLLLIRYPLVLSC